MAAGGLVVLVSRGHCLAGQVKAYFESGSDCPTSPGRRHGSGGMQSPSTHQASALARWLAQTPCPCSRYSIANSKVPEPDEGHRAGRRTGQRGACTGRLLLGHSVRPAGVEWVTGPGRRIVRRTVRKDVSRFAGVRLGLGAHPHADQSIHRSGGSSSGRFNPGCRGRWAVRRFVTFTFRSPCRQETSNH